MGQRKKLSEGDISKINAFYNCSVSVDLNGFKPSKTVSNYKEIKTDLKTFNSYNLNKNSNSGVASFASLEDFRIRTGRREPPPGFKFAFSLENENSKLREQTEFTNFKQYPSMDENFIKKKIIQCPTKVSGNCMDRLD
uniref:Peptidase M12A domain-containing protein n=1 Tax=Panagrolaimus sp. PS1159 TaxID=55785 RepID=A0AC35F323_9BILA